MILAAALVLGLEMGSMAPVPDGAATVTHGVPALAALPGVSLRYYDVAGRNVPAIRRNMDRLRPAEPDGRRFDALTTWNFSWRMRQPNGPCVPANLDVRADVNVMLPRAIDYSRLSRRDRARWDRYYAALVGHETNHARIAIDGGEMIQRELRQLSSCGEMQAVGTRLADAVEKTSQDYDVRTNHGRAEGAVFP